jgi:SEC-C motif-containing protein
MRSRYTAYARREVDYLIDTHLPHDEARRSGILAWAERAAFVGLEVLETVAGQPEDETGVVEFIAHTQEGGREQHHRERSRFVRQGGRWYFIDGDASSPALAPTGGLARVGRNEPCPCGSGKKYKKCCGG